MPDISRRRAIQARVTAARKLRAEAPKAAPDPRSSPRFQGRRAPRDEEGFQWEIPTTSSNPARPRTLQAGYNKDTKQLRVEFRDGTPWQYEDVSPSEWSRFRKSASPGRFINRVLNQHPYGPGDWSP